MASDDRLKRMIEKTEEFKRKTKNMKSRIRRRQKKLEKVLDPLEMHRIEAEIELLKREIDALEFEEFKFNLPIIDAMIKFGVKNPSMDGIDWSKAGRA